MTLVGLIVMLVIVGVVLYCVEVLIPMDTRIKRVIEAVVILGIFLYVLQTLGIFDSHVALR